MNQRKLLLSSVLLLVLAALLPLVLADYGTRLLNAALVAAVAVLGLNFVFGYAGLISLGHAAFVGVGAYTVALLTTAIGVNSWVAVPCAVVLSALSAFVTGWILLRIKGHYLALATLGLNVSFTIVASNWMALTGGSNGVAGIPTLSLAGIELGDERRFYWFALAVLALLTWLAARIRGSYAGRAMVAVRDDEIATAMSGLAIARVKVAAFTLGGAYAGVAGCLFAFHMKFVSPDDFNFSHSITYLSMLIVGGEGTLLGSILGAVGVTLLPEVLRGLGNAYLLVFGLLVLLVLAVLPNGLAGLLARWRAPVGAQGAKP
ncbi:MAG TPA: branched-chain amino acid ABC transporter permease [Bordetella sp.]